MRHTCTHIKNYVHTEYGTYQYVCADKECVPKNEMNCLVDGTLLTQWLLVATQEAITCANVDQDIRRHMAWRGTMSEYDFKVPFGQIKNK